MGYSRKKIKQRGRGVGGLVIGYTFVKTAPEFFILLLYPCKFQKKQSSTPGYSTQLCLLPRSLRNSKAKNKDPWKFDIIFSWSTPEIPRAISLIPLEIPYPPPSLPVWIFSGITQLLFISYIWLLFIIYQ